MTDERSPWRAWAPDVGVGAAVFVVGLLEVVSQPDRDNGGVTLSLGIGAAVALSRRAPGAALTLVWVMFGFQLVEGVPILTVELAVGAVAFGTARWGSFVTAVLAAASMPLAAFIAISGSNYDRFRDFAISRDSLDLAYRFGDTAVAAAFVVATLALAAPFLAGLAFRFLDRARTSRRGQVAAEEDVAQAVRETEQAQEIARLRDGQARMARDVHDVVGHSLAVILAQAESAQYLPDDDPAALKQTMANIATSARSSLQDVRGVLAPAAAPTAARPGGLDTLVEGVRASGHEVTSSEVGVPQPMPPELETVAYRVMQEMLTNAIKHGRRDQPVLVERHWPDGLGRDLRIEVRNSSAPTPDSDLTQPLVTGAGGQGLDGQGLDGQGAGGQGAGGQGAGGQGEGGQGLAGMQRRLESVGGRIDVRRRVEADGPTFTATAWVPVRSAR